METVRCPIIEDTNHTTRVPYALIRCHLTSNHRSGLGASVSEVGSPAECDHLREDKSFRNSARLSTLRRQPLRNARAGYGRHALIMASHFNAMYNVIVYWATWVEDAGGNVLYYGDGWSPCGRWYTSKAAQGRPGGRDDAWGPPRCPCNVRLPGGGLCGCNHWSRDCPHGVNPHRAGRLRNAPRVRPSTSPSPSPHPQPCSPSRLCSATSACSSSSCRRALRPRRSCLRSSTPRWLTAQRGERGDMTRVRHQHQRTR